MNSFSVRLKRENIKILAFEAILFTFSHMKLSLKSLLKLIESKLGKVIILGLLKNVRNSMNAMIMENCFGMPTFYIGFCYYQLHQYGNY